MSTSSTGWGKRVATQVGAVPRAQFVSLVPATGVQQVNQKASLQDASQVTTAACAGGGPATCSPARARIAAIGRRWLARRGGRGRRAGPAVAMETENRRECFVAIGVICPSVWRDTGRERRECAPKL